MPTTYAQLEQDYYKVRRELTAADEMALRLNEIINVQLSQLAASESRLIAANERIRELSEAVAHLNCINGALRVDSDALTAERAVSDKLEAALAHYATDETADGWTAIAALAEVEAMRKGDQV